jgi:hypothetical protein
VKRNILMKLGGVGMKEIGFQRKIIGTGGELRIWSKRECARHLKEQVMQLYSSA